MEDLDIFSGGHDSSAKSDSTHIPKISEVESNVRGDGAKSPGLVSKVTNFLGFNVESEPLPSSLKTDIDDIRNGTPRISRLDEYPKLNPTAARTSIPAKPVASSRKAFSKRHLLEKIGYYIRKLNDIRDTKTTSDITVHSSIEEIRAEYEELRDEYHMASTINGYETTIVESAAYLESFGTIVDLPINTDGLESAISLSMRDCGEQFEQIYEEYGAVRVNPILSVGMTILSTVIKTHLLQSAMNTFGPSVADDPEINEIINKRAAEMGEKYANTSVPAMVSSMKTSEAQFKSGFHFADPIIKNHSDGAGPPPPIHTKIARPPATEETAEQIKKMGSTLLPVEEELPVRVPMKGPSTTVNMSNFLESIKAPPAGSDRSMTRPDPPPVEKKKSRGRKATNTTVSIDI